MTPSRNRGVIALLSAVAYFGMAGGALITPLLPTLVGSLGVTEGEAGLVISMYTLSTALALVVFTVLADRLGRKAIMVPCLLLNGVAGSMVFLTSDLNTIYALRFVQGVGIAGMTPIAIAVIGDVFSGLDRVGAMGRVSLAIAIGAITAPTIGGALATIEWNVPFLFYSLTVPLGFLVYVSLPETRGGGEAVSLGELVEGLGRSRVAAVMVLNLGMYFLLYAFVLYLPFLIKEDLGLGSGEAGLILSLQGLSVGAVSLALRGMASRVSSATLMSAGLVLMSVCLLWASVASDLLTMLILPLVFGAGFGTVNPLLNDRMVGVAPHDLLAGISSAFYVMAYAGMTISPLVLGKVLSSSGLGAVFLTAGALGLLLAFSALLAFEVGAREGTT